MREDIYNGIVKPLDSYLNGHRTEKDVKWSRL